MSQIVIVQSSLGVPVRVAVPPILAENGMQRTSPFPRFLRLFSFDSVSCDLSKTVSSKFSFTESVSGWTLELNRDVFTLLFDDFEGSFESVSSSCRTERTIGNIIAVVAVFEMN